DEERRQSGHPDRPPDADATLGAVHVDVLVAADVADRSCRLRLDVELGSNRLSHLPSCRAYQQDGEVGRILPSRAGRDSRRPRSLAGQARLEEAQMLIALSVANMSISASSSAESSMRSSAAMFSSSCSTLLAPITVDVMRGSRSTQASAI